MKERLEWLIANHTSSIRFEFHHPISIFQDKSKKPVDKLQPAENGVTPVTLRQRSKTVESVCKNRFILKRESWKKISKIFNFRGFQLALSLDYTRWKLNQHYSGFKKRRKTNRRNGQLKNVWNQVTEQLRIIKRHRIPRRHVHCVRLRIIS